MRTAILIHGPTASGKSALAIALAKRFGGEVINADSMQVYGDLRVISARPSEEDMQDVPHHLFGHVPASERYSTGRWLKDIAPVIQDVQSRGQVPIIIGGTGLYHLCLIEGLSEMPPVPDDIRAEVSAIAKQGTDVLYDMVKRLDPVSAERLEPRDKQRLSRALEVFFTTGQSISSLQNNRTRPVLGANEWLGVALTPPRAALYRRIDRRFEGMLMEGAMEEARHLLSLDLPEDLPIMRAHGVPWLMAYLRKDLSAEQAAERAKRDTRRYAKRQFTWIGRQFPFWPRIPSTSRDDQMRVMHALYKEVDDL